MTRPLSTLEIARRIKSRFAKISDGYASGPFSNENDSSVKFLFNGREFEATVTLLLEGNPRPAGFDHIFGDRPKVDQLRLAELASKSISEMARISINDADVIELDPWHKAGVAGFVVRSAWGERYTVQVREIDVMEQITRAQAAIAENATAA